MKRCCRLMVLMSLCAVGLFADIAKGSYGPPLGAGNDTPFGVDPSFSFTYIDDTVSGWGAISAVDLGGGAMHVTSGVLHLTKSPSPNTPLDAYTLIAAGPSAAPSPTGAFIVNNILYPTGSPQVDGWGLLFGKGNLEINIWGNSWDHDYTFVSGTAAGVYDIYHDRLGTFTVGVPEPEVLLLLGVTVPLGLALGRLLKRISC